MVTAAVEQNIDWVSPPPLWGEQIDFTQDPARLAFRSPAVLRFATDAFMEEFLASVDTAPDRLRQLVARPEVWTSPLAGPPAPERRKLGLAGKLQRLRLAAEAKQAKANSSANGTAAGLAMKLFQPAHQRYYLVTASLVCRTAGLPDRRIDHAAQERVTFVVRMLRSRSGGELPLNPDPNECDEYAFVNNAWQAPPAPGALAAGEEQLPMSPVAYTTAEGRRRRLLVGLVPVGKREAYYGAVQPVENAQPNPEAEDVRVSLLRARVTGPWQALIDLATARQKILGSTRPDDADPEDTPEKIRARANAQLQEGSFYTLLDLAAFLKDYLPNVSDPLVLDALDRLHWPSKKLSAVLSEITPETSFANWTYKLAGLTGDTDVVSGLDVDSFEQRLTDAVVKQTPAGTLPPPRLAALSATASPAAVNWFAIRCVFERPACGDLDVPVMSATTVAFQLASFFDPAAPARPIRIGLPIDPSPEGLRKVDKNTAFVMSDLLACHVKRIRGMTFGDLVLSVLPWPFHKSLPDATTAPCPDAVDPEVQFGLVCSLSIPIITICALILLMIIVKLLDIIFNWIPYFVLCFPVKKK